MMKKFIYNNRIMLTVLLVMFLSIFIIRNITLVNAKENSDYEKSFITIEIQQGDTLTSIAEEYAISPTDYMNYIEEVKDINNLKNETIHSGCYLLIPVYTLVQ